MIWLGAVFAILIAIAVGESVHMTGVECFVLGLGAGGLGAMVGATLDEVLGR